MYFSCGVDFGTGKKTPPNFTTREEKGAGPEIHRIAALKALTKMGKSEDIESLLDLLADDAQGWSKGDRQKESFELLAELDRKLYCPYYDELKRERIAREGVYGEYHVL